MKTLYIFFILLTSLALTDRAHAQHLNIQETQQLKNYFDKHLLKILTKAKIQAEHKLHRNSGFSTLSDSIHTFSKFEEGDPYMQGINYYFTFEVVGSEVIIRVIDLKILDASFPIDNIKAVPTYDSQQRISKITMTTNFAGIPLNILNYFYNYDSAGNTTSIILESPGILGGETTFLGDSIEFIYETGGRVAGYNSYTREEDNWIITNGVANLIYDGNGNLTNLTQWYPIEDSTGVTPNVDYTFREIKWYNNSMPPAIVNPLGSVEDEIESELIGIEIATASETYKLEPISFIQATYVDFVLTDSTLVRTFEEASNRFTIFDSYYETGDFIYTEVGNYHYNAQEELISYEILFDLGFGDPVPVNKTDYEHSSYGLTKSEGFTFDQGEWISTNISTFEFLVLDNELLEYTETNLYDTLYESFKSVFFPSDVLETSVSETLLSEEIINVFPTIANQNLTISFPQHSTVQDVKVTVFGLDGQELLFQRFDLATQSLDINVSKLSSGFYFLNVQMTEGMRTIRFVKE